MMNESAENYSRYQTTQRRIGAAFLDGAALAPLQWLDQLVWSGVADPVLLVLWIVLLNTINIGYSIFFLTRFGQTPGKMACGVKVLDLNGGSLSLIQAVMRDIVPALTLPYFIYLQSTNILSGHLANRGLGDNLSAAFGIMAVFFGWGLLEFITMITNKKRRAIHDFIAGTVVIREDIEKIAWRKTLRGCLIVLFVLHLLVSGFINDKNMRAGNLTNKSNHPSSAEAPSGG